MTHDPTPIPPKRAFSETTWKVLLLVLVPFLLFNCVFDFIPLILLTHLLAGWCAYLVRVVPQVYISRPGLLTAAASLIALITLGHITAKWAYRETAQAGQPPRPWKLRWTAIATATLVLLFASGTALVGITHQTAWLAKSDKPLFQNSRVAYRVRCMSNLRQIGQALQMYAHEHRGRYPAALDELMQPTQISGNAFECPAAIERQDRGIPTTQEVAHLLRQARGTYVFLTPNLTPPTDPATAANLPVVCEPLANHDGRGMNILFADGRVEWHTPDQAAQILNPR